MSPLAQRAAVLAWSLVSLADTGAGAADRGLRSFLSGIDDVPDRCALTALSETPAVDLFTFALDGELPRYERDRAVSLLGQIADASADVALTWLVYAAPESRTRGVAVLAYAVAFGRTRPMEAVALARAVLLNPDATTRELAAAALSRISGPASAAALRAAAIVEPQPGVATAIGRALERQRSVTGTAP